MSSNVIPIEQRQARRQAAAERRARDGISLVARIPTSKESYDDYRVHAPKDYGIPTVELKHIDLPGPILLLPDQAEALGKALIAAAEKARA